VEAGSNTSTVAPRVVGGYKSEPSTWATLFLGYINKGTWPSRLGESQISDSKMWAGLGPENNCAGEDQQQL
jgi:hypothetical protein